MILKHDRNERNLWFIEAQLFKKARLWTVFCTCERVQLIADAEHAKPPEEKHQLMHFFIHQASDAQKAPDVSWMKSFNN